MALETNTLSPSRLDARRSCRRATVELKDETRQVRGRAAEGDERSRLWDGWRYHGDDVDAYDTRRSTETAVIILEPRYTP